MSQKYAKWIMAYPHNVYNILEGGIRSGKTTIMILALCRHVEKMDRSGTHILAAESIGLAKEILGVGGSELGILAYFGSRATERQINKQDAIVLDMGKNIKHTFYFKGHSKSNSWEALRGMTIDTITITEASIAHPSFIEEAKGRILSADPKYRRLTMDLNPTAASAPIYTDYIDPWTNGTLEMIDGVNFMTCSLFDNPSFSEEKKKSVMSEYDPDSPVFKAMILGERISSANLVYVFRDYNKLAPEKLNDVLFGGIKEYVITVDVGVTNSATTFITLAKGHDDKLYLLDHYYHRNGQKALDDQSFITADDYIVELIKYRKRTIEELNIEPTYIYIDRDVTFRRLLYNAFVKEGIRTDNMGFAIKDKIDDRILALSSKLYKGEFLVAPDNEKVIDAFNAAVYDQKELSKSGKLVRVDNTNLEFNPLDVLDAIEYAISYYSRQEVIL